MDESHPCFPDFEIHRRSINGLYLGNPRSAAKLAATASGLRATVYACYYDRIPCPRYETLDNRERDLRLAKPLHLAVANHTDVYLAIIREWAASPRLRRAMPDLVRFLEDVPPAKQEAVIDLALALIRSIRWVDVQDSAVRLLFLFPRESSREVLYELLLNTRSGYLMDTLLQGFFESPAWLDEALPLMLKAVETNPDKVMEHLADLVRELAREHGLSLSA